MEVEELFADESVSLKEKVEVTTAWLSEGKLSADDLYDFARYERDSVKAGCIEAIHYASENRPLIVSEALLTCLIGDLSEKSTRVCTEAAFVIGNVADLYTDKLDLAIERLILNADHKNVSVREGAATALVVIAKTRPNLFSIIELLYHQESKNSIKKIYREIIRDFS